MSSTEKLIPEILLQYSLTPSDYRIDRIGSGYIHDTFKLSGKNNYILQRVNKNVFTKPEVIASNLKIAADHLKLHFPEYIFLSAIPGSNGGQMVYDNSGFPWRLFPYVENTFTIDKVESPDEAYSAAAEFARLTYNLKDADVNLFHPTIGKFHDLSLRYQQFENSLKGASEERITKAKEAISASKNYRYLVDQYEALINSGDLKLRITHNDTKINNILFDIKTRKAICAIDLDTLMPGYFIYDLGDMIRTFVSPVDEEEQDLTRVIVRKNIYQALTAGYLSVMEKELRAGEMKAISFSGMMMTYIMALRMLADYLNGDIYYKIRYENQNLIRASNQLKLLEELRSMKL